MAISEWHLNETKMFIKFSSQHSLTLCMVQLQKFVCVIVEPNCVRSHALYPVYLERRQIQWRNFCYIT